MKSSSSVKVAFLPMQEWTLVLNVSFLCNFFYASLYPIPEMTVFFVLTLEELFPFETVKQTCMTPDQCRKAIITVVNDELGWAYFQTKNTSNFKIHCDNMIALFWKGATLPQSIKTLISYFQTFIYFVTVQLATTDNALARVCLWQALQTLFHRHFWSPSL